MQRLAVVIQDAGERESQFGIVIVREVIDEVDDGLSPLHRHRRRSPSARDAAQKRTAGERRQSAFSGDSDNALQQPAGAARREQRVHEPRRAAKPFAPQVNSREEPIRRGWAMRGEVLGLGLDHQVRHIDVVDTLQPTLPAVETLLRELAQVGRRQFVNRDAPVHDGSDRVGLRAGRAIFGGLGPKERTHPQRRLLRATPAATVTRRRRRRELGRGPVELQLVQVRLHGDGGTKMPHREMRIVGQHLAGIEQVERIEDVLDLLKDAVQLAVLRPEESGARQTETMLTADRTADRQCRVIEVTREGLQTRAVLRSWQWKERTDVQLTGGGVRIERRRHFMPLQHAPHPHDELFQRGGRNRDIFDERHRTAARATHSVEQRHDAMRQRPEELQLFRRPRDEGGRAGIGEFPESPRQRSQLARDFVVAEPDMLDEQRRFGRRREQSFKTWVGVPRECEQTTVEQIAGTWPVFDNASHRAHRAIERSERNQHRAAMSWQRHRLQHRRREQRECPFRTDEQSR